MLLLGKLMWELEVKLFGRMLPLHSLAFNETHNVTTSYEPAGGLEGRLGGGRAGCGTLLPGFLVEERGVLLTAPAIGSYPGGEMVLSGTEFSLDISFFKAFP